MKTEHLFIFDTNALISAFLTPRSVSRLALNHAIRLGNLAISSAVLDEFSQVLFRKKFNRYFLNNEERLNIIDKLQMNAIFFSPIETIKECRDSKDNMFLELAIAANADCIITGDKALLELDPFRNVRILNATRFLELF